MLNFVLVKRQSFKIHVLMNKKYSYVCTYTYAHKHIYVYLNIMCIFCRLPIFKNPTLEMLLLLLFLLPPPFTRHQVGLALAIYAYPMKNNARRWHDYVRLLWCFFCVINKLINALLSLIKCEAYLKSSPWKLIVNCFLRNEGEEGVGK